MESALPAAHSSLSDDDFLIEDLLDFPTDDNLPSPGDTGITGSSAHSVVNAAFNSDEPPSDACVNRRASAECQFPAEFGVPLDDLPELEWLSNFVEESFSSSEDLQKFQLGQTIQARPDHYQPHPARPTPTPTRVKVSVPAKARSKRSRAAPGNWTSRLLVVSPTPPPAATSSSDSSDVVTTTKKAAKRSKKEGSDTTSGGEGRRCLHCATDKTPQWRTGPMGPKTLCNACGVRYKSGRLVPEYRPAASPTFVLTKHSNSHRKVLELRKQKEQLRVQQQQQQQQFMDSHPTVMMYEASSNGEDYLMHQHVGPDFRQLI